MKSIITKLFFIILVSVVGVPHAYAMNRDNVKMLCAAAAFGLSCYGAAKLVKYYCKRKPQQELPAEEDHIQQDESDESEELVSERYKSFQSTSDEAEKYQLIISSSSNKGKTTFVMEKQMLLDLYLPAPSPERWAMETHGIAYHIYARLEREPLIAVTIQKHQDYISPVTRKYVQKENLRDVILELMREFSFNERVEQVE